MRKKGLTLIELITTMVVGSIAVLALTCQFVAESRFRGALRNDITILEDADIAMRHMTTVLRFAIPGTVSGIGTNQLSATIEGGYHIAYIQSNSAITYARDVNNNLTYTYNGNTSVIARNITSFTTTQSGNEVTIQLTAQKGSKKDAIQTMILLLCA